jgi:hypothetical protein
VKSQTESSENEETVAEASTEPRCSVQAERRESRRGFTISGHGKMYFSDEHENVVTKNRDFFVCGNILMARKNIFVGRGSDKNSCG